MTISKKQTKGECAKCFELVAKKSMAKHLEKCFTDEKGESAFHLFIGGPRKQFWMHVALKETATLQDLDQLLRDEWVECCGHLSLFRTGAWNYVNYEEDLLPQDKHMKEGKAAEILSPGMEFDYEYDFGTTTYVTIKVLGKIKTGSNQKAVVLAQNEMPDAVCDMCGAEATQTVADISNETFCEKCSEKIDEDEKPLLPLVNSPRTGQCGYIGEQLI